MNIILNTDKSYQLSELAKAVQLSDSDLIYVEQEIDGKKVSIAVERGTFLAGLIPSGKAIISGGATWSGTDLIFNVSQVVYRFDGDIDTTLPTQVTLANGGGQPRIDAIVVNAVDNSIEVVQGTEAANPPTPIIGEDQILIQYVLIGAGATEPNITEEVIYRENVEWTGSTVGTITGSVNFNSPNDPCYGSKTVEVSDCDRRARIRWTKISEVDLADYPLMTLTIQLPEPMPGNKKLIANFLRAGSNIGSTISLTNSGLNRNSLECQQLVINTAAFGSGMVDAFQLRMIGGAVNDGANWRVDDIVLFSGYAPPLNTPKINVEDDGTLIGETSDLNFIGGTNVTLNVTQGLDGKINVEINSVGGGGGGISSVVGTDEEIDVDNSDPDNPVLSLASEVTDSLALADTATQPADIADFITEPDVVNTQRNFTKNQGLTSVALSIASGEVSMDDLKDSNDFNLTLDEDATLMLPTTEIASDIRIKVTNDGGFDLDFEAGHVVFGTPDNTDNKTFILNISYFDDGEPYVAVTNQVDADFGA